MKLKLLFWLLLAALFSISLRAQTNSTATNSDALVNGYLQIQEQLHAARMAIEDGRLLAADEAKHNAEIITARLDALEQSVAAQHNADTEAARKNQQLTLLLAGAFGLAGLAIVALLFYLQWRAFSHITQISTQQHTAISNASAVHQLAAPGRATVESSNLDACQRDMTNLGRGSPAGPAVVRTVQSSSNALSSSAPRRDIMSGSASRSLAWSRVNNPRPRPSRTT